MNLEDLWLRLQTILELLGKSISTLHEGATYRVDRSSNQVFALRAFLSFSKDPDGEEVVVAIDALHKDGQLYFDSDITRGSGAILSQGPTMVSREPIPVEHSEKWILEFENFVATNRQLLLEEVGNLA